MISDYKSKKCWNLISNKIMRLFDSSDSILYGWSRKIPHHTPPPVDPVPQAGVALWDSGSNWEISQNIY
jgi:hypothetical protein